MGRESEKIWTLIMWKDTYIWKRRCIGTTQFKGSTTYIFAKRDHYRSLKSAYEKMNVYVLKKLSSSWKNRKQNC